MLDEVGQVRRHSQQTSEILMWEYPPMLNRKNWKGIQDVRYEPDGRTANGPSFLVGHIRGGII